MRSFAFLVGTLAFAGLLAMPLAAEAQTAKKKKAPSAGQSQQQPASNDQRYWTDKHSPVS